MKKFFLFATFFVISSMSLMAQTIVELTEAGTLKEKLPSYSGITSLKVSGPINGSDLRYLREMCGMKVSGGPSAGTLADLDLTDANIVQGGDYYMYDYSTYEEFFTKNDELGSYAFFNCPAIETITLPKTLKKVGTSTFSSSARLGQIIAPEGSEHFYTIDGCLYAHAGKKLVKYPEARNLRYFTVAEGTEIIGYDAISNALSLELVTLPEGLKTIERVAFCFSNNLTHIDIPASVSQIGVSAFNYCSGLEAINVDDANETYTSIDGVVYTKDMQTLFRFPIKRGGTYTVPQSVTAIGDYAFSTSAKVEGIVLPDGLQEIGAWAFDGCALVEEISIPESVNKIGYGAFNDCRRVKSLHLPDGVVYLGDWLFAGCESLTDLQISPAVRQLGVGMLQSCKLLTSFTVPEAVTTLPRQIFYGCEKLAEVVVPAGVYDVAAYAFMGCNSLKQMTVYAEEPPTCHMTSFVGVPTSSCKLLVPYGTKPDYEVANEWKNFKPIEEMEPNGIDNLTDDNTQSSATTGIEGYYSLDGQRLSSQTKGINIVKTTDGKTRKTVIL